VGGAESSSNGIAFRPTNFPRVELTVTVREEPAGHNAVLTTDESSVVTFIDGVLT